MPKKQVHKGSSFNISYENATSRDTTTEPQITNEDWANIRLRDRPRSDFGIAVAGVLLAAAVCVIYWLQLRVMSLELKDKRAWISVDYGADPITDGNPIVATLHISNTGKTPARNVDGVAVTKMLSIGEDPKFLFDHGTGIYLETIFQDSAPRKAVSNMVPDAAVGGIVKPVIATPKIREKIRSGEVYMVVYGRLSYKDVFDDSHWIRFCAVTTNIETSTPPSCLRYNDVDEHE